MVKVEIVNEPVVVADNGTEKPPSYAVVTYVPAAMPLPVITAPDSMPVGSATVIVVTEADTVAVVVARIVSLAMSESSLARS